LLKDTNTEVDLGEGRTAQGALKLLWRSDQASIVESPGRGRLDGRRLVVPGCVLATAYAGAAVRLRVRLATGDVGIVAVWTTRSPSAREL
jgi:hypothetical protein